MNKKGAYFAVLTVIVMIAFLILSGIYKEKVLESNKIITTGKTSENIINLTLKEEEIKFFIDKSMEYASYRALNTLADNGGHKTSEGCNKVQNLVVWQNDCIFPDNLEEEFFDAFKLNIQDKLQGLNLRLSMNVDQNKKLFVTAQGLATIDYGDGKYGFELDEKKYVDYDLDNYNKILTMALGCVEKEKQKGSARNDLFEDCRNNNDFVWIIKTQDQWVLFEIGTKNKIHDLNPIYIKFALPK